MEYVHKKHIVTVDEVKDGVVVLLDYEGKNIPVTEQWFKDYYIGVDLANGKEHTVTKQPSPFELEYSRQLVEFGGLNQTEDDTYINGTRELHKNKAL
jgi:predicted double-glycine peptidase